MHNESGNYLTSRDIAKLFPNKTCCDCDKLPEEYSGKYKWILYHENIIYCPKCAENEGWELVEE